MYYGPDPDAEDSGDSDDGENANGKMKIVVAPGSRVQSKHPEPASPVKMEAESRFPRHEDAGIGPGVDFNFGFGSQNSITPTRHGEDDHETSLLRHLQMKFIPDHFRQRYQRNNKRGGLKNLRCFPLCSAGHKERGFCGRPIMLSVKDPDSSPILYARKTDPQDNPKSLLQSRSIVCWAQFLPVNEDLRLRVGTRVPLSSALALERSRQHPLRPWMRGKRLRNADVAGQLVMDGIQVDPLALDADAYFGFNMETKGWHYGWASNKHSCNAEHSVRVFLFRLVQEEVESASGLNMESVHALQQQLYSISSPSLGASRQLGAGD
ncbi:Hypothetical Protein FCC1311_034152 [Hondaea fermentalgiana]|uniref:Uncharacterized protein n=1 Tax=Hondaea fermentalgiana TaxID=2315210 RepID=A0A2R5G814_9STRA|nr:Hypothetical Protein FCC1311_034152 [Hondaea fermentalgiana]|eukprot:GBG27192.1 Hypothetical Protein FCC1311_034152 [Hondaea fermentalgiana]